MHKLSNSKFRLSIMLLLGFEFIFCLLHFIFCMNTQAPITFGSEHMEFLSSDAFIDAQGGVSVKDSSIYGPYAATPELPLKKGSYRVTVRYTTSHEGGLIRKTNPYVICNNLQLDPYEKQMTFSMWAPSDTSTAFDITNNGGERAIYSISVYPTHAWARTSILAWLCFFIVFDFLVLYCFSKKLRLLPSFPHKKRPIFLGILLVIFLSNLPLLIDPLIITGDLSYHLARIQGLADGIVSGMFPVRIMPGLANGNGYASSVFYCDLFLYFPAFLRLIGFSLQASYKFFLLFINIITVLTAYHCFHPIIKDDTCTLIATALYTLSSYRLLDVYTRGAVGEYTAMTFFPLILYFLYEAYTLNPKDSHYKHLWLPGFIGFSGIVLSHVISCILVAIFVLITCLLFIKKTIRPATFILLAKTASLTILVCLWFLLPFVDYYFSHDLRVNSISPDILSTVSEGIYPAQLFDLIPHAHGQSMPLLQGISGELYFSLGAPLLVAVACFIYCAFILQPESELKFFKPYWVLFAFGALSACMATTVFPWYLICSSISLFSTIFSSIQFPWRFLSLSVCIFSLVGGIGIFQFYKKSQKIFPHILTLLLATIVFSSGCYFHDLFRTAPIMSCYDLHDIYNATSHDQNMRLQAQLSYGEYLPAETPIYDFWSYTDLLYDSNDIAVEIVEENGLDLLVYAENRSDVASSMVFPRTFYRDYHVLTSEGIDICPVFKSKTSQVEIQIPAGFSGQLELKFKVPWYWHAAELISIITILLLLIFSIFRVIHSRKAALSNDKVTKEFS